ncbi:MAG TPA: vWA domain-containing protein, partial [Pirellulales bacterium]|nr:vWA domain-containing protein [Pirellulales bacterium]
MLTELLGRLMGVEKLQSIDSIRVSLAAPWAQNGPAWALFGCVALTALAVIFYSRYQPRKRKKTITLLTISRAILLAMLFLILAEPVLKLEFTSRPRPLLWVLFDGTESMEIQDEMTDRQRARLAEAVGLTNGSATDSSANGEGGADNAIASSDAQNGSAAKSAATLSGSQSSHLSRMEYVKALLSKPTNNILNRLEEKFRVQAFILDRPDGVRELSPSNSPSDSIDPKQLINQLTTKGQLTAIGTAFNNLAEAQATSHLAGVVMFSDFGNNSGPAPAGTAASPVKKLGVPVYAVGIGPRVAVDLATSVEMPR